MLRRQGAQGGSQAPWTTLRLDLPAAAPPPVIVERKPGAAVPSLTAPHPLMASATVSVATEGVKQLSMGEPTCAACHRALLVRLSPRWLVPTGGPWCVRPRIGVGQGDLRVVRPAGEPAGIVPCNFAATATSCPAAASNAAAKPAVTANIVTRELEAGDYQKGEALLKDWEAGGSLPRCQHEISRAVPPGQSNRRCPSYWCRLPAAAVPADQGGRL